MYPAQGSWTLEEYLELTDSTNRLIEFTDGRLEFLEMPTPAHQLILLFLMDRLRAFAEPGLGMVLFSGLRVVMDDTKVREPDLVFLREENYAKRGNRVWEGADLVMEIVSDDAGSRARDYHQKVSNYAAAGIPEYWIVDPQENKITVLTLSEGADAYSEHGVFKPGDSATSKLLDGFAVDVQATFDAAKA